MANVINQNPLIIDTASATPFITGRIAIEKFRWIIDSGSAGGDAVVVKDGVGKTVWEAVLADVGASADVVLPEDSNFITPFVTMGLAVTTLAAGTKLYIYYKGATPLN
jgi:hypothetical protein